MDLSVIMCLLPVPDHVGFCQNYRKRDYLLGWNLIKLQFLLQMWRVPVWLDALQGRARFVNCWHTQAPQSDERSNDSRSISSANPHFSDANEACEGTTSWVTLFSFLPRDRREDWYHSHVCAWWSFVVSVSASDTVSVVPIINDFV